VNFTGLYIGANFLFVLLIAAGSAVTDVSTGRLIYLTLLFAICSSPLMFMRRLNDRYVLLALFSAVFFQHFGLLDVIHIAQGVTDRQDSELPSLSESVILAGGLVAHFAYHLGCRFGRVSRPSGSNDWRESMILWFGSVMWLITTSASAYFKIFIIKAQTAETVARGFASLGSFETMGFMLANLAQPMGILFLSYAYFRFNRKAILPLLIAMLLVQMVVGFVVDSKAETVIGFVLVAVSYLLIRGTIPKVWVAVVLALLVLAFPVMQANRTVRGAKGIDAVETLMHLDEVFSAALKASERVMKGPDRANTSFERLSLKGSVEMIVDGIEEGHQLQNGYTLMPILTAFIPRVLWPEKPDVQTGQVLNKEFHVSDVAYTYISPSHLGEMYWNFGWAGVLVGMSAFGMGIGFIGGRFDCTREIAITDLLVLLTTTQFLILRSEGELAVQYVQWMRALAIIGLLHLALARRSVVRETKASAPKGPSFVRYNNLLQ
jgi:hypothetical protein